MDWPISRATSRMGTTRRVSRNPDLPPADIEEKMAMSENEYEDEHEEEHEHDVEEALEEALELDTQSQIFLEMRRQNVDLLKIAAEVAGYSGNHPPLKSGDLKMAMRAIWDVYSEFYAWIDPEESDDDEDDEDDDL
jgi:hypothetical protein